MSIKLTDAGIIIEFNAIVFQKAYVPILLRVEIPSNVIDVKACAVSNALASNVVTEDGIDIDVKFIVKKNALLPREIKPVGRLMVVKLIAL